MIGLGLLVVLVGLAIYWTLKGKESYEGWCFTLLWCGPLKIIFCLLIWVFITCIIARCHPLTPREVEESYSLNIYSVGLGNKVQGTFRLGCGTVDEKPVYRFFYKTDGGFKCGEVLSDETLIVESDKVPHITYITQYKYTGEANWLIDAYFGEFDFWRWFNGENDHGNVIYVPKGSIIQTFAIQP